MVKFWQIPQVLVWNVHEIKNWKLGVCVYAAWKSITTIVDNFTKQKLRALLPFIPDQSLVLLPPYLSIKTWSEMNTKEGKCRIWHWVNVSANQFGLFWTKQQIFSSERNYFGLRRTIRQRGHPVGKQSGARQDVVTINDLEIKSTEKLFLPTNF